MSAGPHPCNAHYSADICSCSQKSKTSFPALIALMPTVAAALIISAQESHFNRKILSGPVLVFIDFISYPLYLWHCRC